MMLRTLGVLAVAVLAAAACGDGGGGEVTIEEYYRLTDELSRTKEREQAEIDFGDYPGFNFEVDDTKSVFERLAHIEDKYESGLSDIQPPAVLGAIHADLLAYAQRRLAALDVVVGLLSGTDSAADVNDLIGPILPEFAEAESARSEACRALDDFAVATGVSEGDACAHIFLIKGASMEPTAENGDLLDVYPYRNERPQRGDVIVFNSPPSPDRQFMKRIIGLPGDALVIDEVRGEVTINSVPLDEPYVQGTTSCGSACEVGIPAAGSQESFDTCGSSECYFIMGDNRQNSSDSRQGWLLPVANVVGWVDVP